MSNAANILVVGGYGEVGRRVAAILESSYPGCVIVGGRNPQRAGDLRARRIDVDDPTSVDLALDGVDVVVACVRQVQPHLLHAAVRRGIAYTSIAPRAMPWSEVQALHEQAQGSGARAILGAGIEPGIASVLARVGADRLGRVDAVETALLLAIGDAYGPNSMVFLMDEIAQAYEVLVDGRMQPAHAFGRSKRVAFPGPVGERSVYTMPFTDQHYYPQTLGARTSVAWVAVDPPWLGSALSVLTRIGARALMRRRGGRDRIHQLTETLRRHYAHLDQFALVVEVRAGDRVVRSSLAGRQQAQATAVGVGAIAEALHARERVPAGVWLAEQVIELAPFLARLAAHGLHPNIEELTASSRAVSPRQERPTTVARRLRSP